MRAAVIAADGTMAVEQTPTPRCGPTDVLVEVRAAALNRADLSIRSGRYRALAATDQGPVIGGLEAAGVVVEVGDEVTRYVVGDRVMALCANAHAEFVAMDERVAIRVPPAMTWTEAAATPVAFLTEYDALNNAARFSAGDALLITAAGSVVGTAGLQLALAQGASQTVVTVVGERQRDLANRLGATCVVDVQQDADICAAVRDVTGGRGVDIVLDHVGGSMLAENLGLMRVGGRLVSIGRLGDFTGPLDMDLLARNQLSVIGVSFRTRTLDDVATIVHGFEHDVWPLLDRRAIGPVVDTTFPFDQVLQAQDYMSSNRHLGKIVLDMAAEHTP